MAPDAALSEMLRYYKAVTAASRHGLQNKGPSVDVADLAAFLRDVARARKTAPKLRDAERALQCATQSDEVRGPKRLEDRTTDDIFESHRPSLAPAHAWLKLRYGSRREPETPLGGAECARYRRRLPRADQAAVARIYLLREETKPSQSRATLLCVAWAGATRHGHDVARLAAVTWLARCDGALVLTDDNATFPEAIMLPASMPRTTVARLRFLVERGFSDDFDYVAYVSRPTYVVPVNLRAYLAEARPSYAGQPVAGVVLHRTALHALANIVVGDRHHQPAVGKEEQRTTTPERNDDDDDLYLRACLAEAGIAPADSRDARGRPRFHNGTLADAECSESSNNGTSQRRLTSASAHHAGTDCCSPHSVSFQPALRGRFRRIDTLLYRCSPSTRRH